VYFSDLGGGYLWLLMISMITVVGDAGQGGSREPEWRLGAEVGLQEMRVMPGRMEAQEAGRNRDESDAGRAFEVGTV
jgi:hypothetical protein